MAQTFPFPVASASTKHPREKKPPSRQLVDKFQEIALRSPKDLAAFETVADRVLARLNEEDRQRHH